MKGRLVALGRTGSVEAADPDGWTTRSRARSHTGRAKRPFTRERARGQMAGNLQGAVMSSSTDTVTPTANSADDASPAWTVPFAAGDASQRFQGIEMCVAHVSELSVEVWVFHGQQHGRRPPSSVEREVEHDRI